ncbi:hypothetical protein RhiirC2_776789 [Rhizophagus irregularis]|uniref:Crinkler effector protein N-terminal domain-containing protein n=1 Tax=Rhizophagus irregularis TaxID=588596 RepID=A0A2N1NFU5_9GLOM|nr:hypothetical protein RhiirC2_776789 [Rhizophagus irregularis]
MSKGNTIANAFSVKISRGKPVSELNDAIKAKKAPEFDNFTTESSSYGKDYWTEKPPKRNIHVEPLVSNATSSEVLELREQLASLRDYLISLSMVPLFLHFNVIVSPKRMKGFKWTVDIEDATLEDLKEYIRKECELSALEM